jgi:hypothetical protein
MAIVFNVVMDVENMEDMSVLVFLRPVPAQWNSLIHAWQVLTASAGTIASFDYSPRISTNVFSRHDPSRYILSETKEVQPGSLLQVVNAGEPSPRLEMAPASLAQEKLTPRQVGVINNTDPYIELDCNWMVNGKTVVTIPDPGQGMTCTFEPASNLYFKVAKPPLVGQTYIPQDFADMTSYAIPTTDTEVYVVVTKEKGRWAFSFDEKI